MPRSSVNFWRGRILPRATPVRSGTRHSISVTRCWSSHCSRSLKVKWSWGSWGTCEGGGVPRGGAAPKARARRQGGGRARAQARGRARGRGRRARLAEGRRMRIDTGLSAACHSGCHCTHRLKPGPSAEKASTRPSGARASTRRPSASRLTPWPCTELTSKRRSPTDARQQPPGTHVHRVRRGRTGSAADRPSARWSARPGHLLHRLVQLPPSATLVSCAPRQMASSGMPRPAHARDQRQRPGVAVGVQRQRGVVHASPKCEGCTLDGEPVSSTPSARSSRRRVSCGSAPAPPAAARRPGARRRRTSSWMPAGEHRAHRHAPLVRPLAVVIRSGVTPKRLRAEGVAGAAEAGDDLVEDQQDAVLVADLAQALQVALRRHQHAGGAGHRLDDHRGDGEASCSATRRSRSSASSRRAPAGRALKALRAGSCVWRQVVHAGQHGAEHLAVAHHAADRDAAEVDAVVAALAADQPGALALAAGAVVGQRDLQRGVDRLGAGVGEEDLVQPSGAIDATALGASKAISGGPSGRSARSPASAACAGAAFDDPRRPWPALHAPQAGGAVEDLWRPSASSSACPRRNVASRRGCLLELPVGGEGHPEGVEGTCFSIMNLQT
jgi:hypothetical protein